METNRQAGTVEETAEKMETDRQAGTMEETAAEMETDRQAAQWKRQKQYKDSSPRSPSVPGFQAPDGRPVGCPPPCPGSLGRC